MDRLRLVVAVAAMFVIASVGAAVAADGDPVIIGQDNIGTSETTIYNQDGNALLVAGEGDGFNVPLWALNESGTYDSYAARFTGSSGRALFVEGSITYDHAFGIVVPAGQRKASRQLPSDLRFVCNGTFRPLAYATTQGDGPPVQNVTLCGEPFTVRLTRAAVNDTLVAVVIFN